MKDKFTNENLNKQMEVSEILLISDLEVSAKFSTPSCQYSDCYFTVGNINTSRHYVILVVPKRYD